MPFSTSWSSSSIVQLAFDLSACLCQILKCFLDDGNSWGRGRGLSSTEDQFFREIQTSERYQISCLLLGLVQTFSKLVQDFSGLFKTLQDSDFKDSLKMFQNCFEFSSGHLKTYSDCVKTHSDFLRTRSLDAFQISSSLSEHPFQDL